MNILINLISIKGGGGLQVALNFVKNLKNIDTHKFKFIVTRDTLIEKSLLQNYNSKDVYSIKKSLISRLYFEKFSIATLIKKEKIELIYTLFGVGIKKRGIINVVGVAYSNLFFPEINFWGNWNFIYRIYFKILDTYRIYNIKRADAWVFENSAMMEQSINLLKFPKEKVCFIKPSTNLDYKLDNYSVEIANKLNNLPKGFKVLILSNWHKNKNIDIIPEVLSNLFNMNIKDIYFIITVDEKHKFSKKLLLSAKKFQVESNIKLIGSINQLEVGALYHNCSATLLLSLLESFSNNIIETWYFKKPLIISDEKWSRAICKDAALFVQRSDALKIAIAIKELKENNNIYTDIIKAGEKEIDTYPDPVLKVKLQIQFLEKIYNVINDKK